MQQNEAMLRAWPSDTRLADAIAAVSAAAPSPSCKAEGKSASHSVPAHCPAPPGRHIAVHDNHEPETWLFAESHVELETAASMHQHAQHVDLLKGKLAALQCTCRSASPAMTLWT